ncbi:uncharacterized protein LOC124841100 [Vigna umbellata]|uniref:uncharacterized protein LOC124841100 n=1 Tax=Vigna umbellata TaxID=87088 RepID=UPI001F5EFAF3|nr:uncharacterized protein LOC124841100 [Vigna umbellata]
MNINLGDNFMKGVMETGVVHHDLDIGTMKDKKNENDDQPKPKMKDDQRTTKKLRKRKRRESFMHTLDNQENLIAELKRRFVVLKSELAKEKARRRITKDGGQSVPHAEPSMNNGFDSP